MGKYLDIAREFEARRAREQGAQAFSRGGDFLTTRVPQPALAAFPDWQGLLIKSAVLDLSVWVVRSREEGEELAHETGHPALLLDDVLSQKGKTPAEARESLLPLMIMGTVQ